VPKQEAVVEAKQAAAGKEETEAAEAKHMVLGRLCRCSCSELKVEAVAVQVAVANVVVEAKAARAKAV